MLSASEYKNRLLADFATKWPELLKSLDEVMEKELSNSSNHFCLNTTRFNNGSRILGLTTWLEIHGYKVTHEDCDGIMWYLPLK